MTDSYNQHHINMVGFTPASFVTIDATPVVIAFGSITDGQTLTVALWGGGSEPGGTARYVIGREATYVRRSGTGGVTVAGNTSNFGGPVNITFVVDDQAEETICELRVVGTASEYSHNLRFTSISY